MAISRSRLALRASERLATLVAAMRSTQNTAPASIHNASRDLGPVMLKAQRHDADAAVPVGRRQLLVETAGDRAHLRLGLLESHVRSKSSNDEPGTCATRTREALPNPETSCAAPTHPHRVVANLETCREDADDLGRKPVELDGRADRIERASETRLPEAMTDQGQTLPLLGLLGREAAPVQGLNAEQWKEGWVRSWRRLICSAPSAPVSVTDTASKTAISAKLLLWLRHCSTFQ